MIENVLWIAVALMVISALVPRTHMMHKLIGGLGWGTFSIHWAYQPLHYMEINDYVNVGLTICLAVFCLFLAYIMIKEYKGITYNINSSIDITSMATTATAMGSLFYFPFAHMPALNTWIIALVTKNVIWTLSMLDMPAQLISWDTISLHGYNVRIILACTAIESIALFMGLISSVKAPTKRLAAAFMISVPVIYMLNIVRDVFVIIAYGEQWFGPQSFEIAHHMIAKVGSGIALFAIAYGVLRILPELLDLIEGLWKLTMEQVQIIVQRIAGKQ